ncbi:hypothetical protein O1M54_45320 [Streptomyces diastatochromogenes]|nr:hypothetical protein [Streptomyces diastatochromogenes]
MSGPGLARVRPAALGVRVALQPVAHLVFFIVVAAALVRLFRMHSALCWDMVTVSALFAGVYAAGLTQWGRLGAGARHAWVAALLLLWTVLVLLAPRPLTGAYVWCAVPLACAALRALGHHAAKVAVGAVTVVLVGQLSGGAGGFDAETVLVPVAAVWGTVALYRGSSGRRRSGSGWWRSCAARGTCWRASSAGRECWRNGRASPGICTTRSPRSCPAA